MECGIDRIGGETGECRTGTSPKIASYNLHYGEEPPLSGGRGSGTIFFANCSLFCKYCQNYDISQLGFGSEATVEQLTDIMLLLQEKGADNINFVTPTHVLPMILLALGPAKDAGLSVPIVHNSSGYEKVEIIRELEGIIDVYLVDMRYDDDRTAKELSGCDDYVSHNRAAVKEMYRQVGVLMTDDRGLAIKGVIIRHLVLPNDLSGTEGIMGFLADEISRDVYVSLMRQYHPAYQAFDDDRINRRLTAEEFDKAVNSFYDYGLHNGHIQ
jgi:putative pyruvate formate lyase activating enzyme